jgi:hypothetical protein
MLPVPINPIFTLLEGAILPFNPNTDEGTMVGAAATPREAPSDFLIKALLVDTIFIALYN